MVKTRACASSAAMWALAGANCQETGARSHVWTSITIRALCRLYRIGEMLDTGALRLLEMLADRAIPETEGPHPRLSGQSCWRNKCGGTPWESGTCTPRPQIP